MATYVNDLRLKEIATGDESGTWGTSTNTNLELIGNAMGVGAEAIANASTHTITMADGVADEFRSTFLRLTGGGQACTVTLAPNTLSHTWIMRNETSATLTLTQGSGANVAIAAGQTKIVATDGGGSGAIVYEMDDLELAGNLAVGGDLTIGDDLTITDDLNVGDDINLTSDSSLIKFGADGDTTLTHTDGSGLTLNSTNKIMFNDASQFIQGSSATVLSLGATDEIDLTATLIDINGNADVSGTITATGTSVFASLDISGDIDVDGTTNLDVVDIDGAVDFASTTAHAGNATFADNAKAIFGGGSDLQIYHDGSGSFIEDVGTGFLKITSNGDGILLQKSSTETMAQFLTDGAVTFYHDNSLRLSTTSTGIDVTGTVTADGLTVSPSGTQQVLATLRANSGAGGGLVVQTDASDDGLIRGYDSSGNIQLQFDTDGGDNYIAQGNVGIGTSSPDTLVHAYKASNAILKVAEANGFVSLQQSGVNSYLNNVASGGSLIFRNGTAPTERLRIDASGNLLVGGTTFDNGNFSSNANGINVFDATHPIVLVKETTSNNTFLMGVTSAAAFLATQDAIPMGFYTSDAERMRIDASGDVGIGTSSPFFTTSGRTSLSVNGSTSSILAFGKGGSSENYILADAGGFTIANTSTTLPTIFFNNGSERLRIDSSGNLLVGTTNTDPAGTSNNVVGTAIGSSGYLSMTRDGNTVAFFNRKSDDGTVVQFRKDGSVVGSIGSAATGKMSVIGTNQNLQIGANGTNVFNVATTSVYPDTDNATDLGFSSSIRWKDLYLSGGVKASASSGNSAHTFTATANNTRAILTTSAKTSGGVAVEGNFGSFGDASKVDIGTLSNHTTAFLTNNTERMRIDTSGNLLVGKTSVSGTTLGPELRPNGQINAASAGDFLNMYSTSAGVYRFYVTNAGTINATNTSIQAISDESLKENIRDLDKGLDTVLALQPRRFDWKNGDGNDIMGFVAQEVKSVLPELVHEYRYTDEETKLALKMGDMIPSMVKAIQEQQALIESLTARITQLENN